jgi:hypothetical protein
MLGVAPANIVGQTFKMSSALSKKPELFLEKALTRFPKDSVIHSMLQQAISSPNENKKRAIMNTLMQQSAFRNMLKEEDNGEATR